MNEKAERINGWAAMLGIVAAMGSYAVTGQSSLVSGNGLRLGRNNFVWRFLYRLTNG